MAAIDLIGEHIPEGSLASVREKVVAALGDDPVHEGLQFATPGGDDTEIAAVLSRAIASHRLLSFEYYKENEDEFTTRLVEPYALINGREGWYVASFDPSRESVRHFRLDRIKSASVTGESFDPRPDVDPAADVDGWPRTGEVPASRRAQVWISPERARWAREERTVLSELKDRSVIVELGFAGVDWLVREVLKEAGDAVVLAPEDARAAVRAAAETIPAGSGRRLPVSRRDQIAMSAEEVADFLTQQRVVIVATNGPRGWPHLMPLWYLARAGTSGHGRTRSPRRFGTWSAMLEPSCRSRTASSTTSCAE